MLARAGLAKLFSTTAPKCSSSKRRATPPCCPCTPRRVAYTPMRTCPLGCAFVAFPTAEEAASVAAAKHKQYLGQRYVEASPLASTSACVLSTEPQLVAPTDGAQPLGWQVAGLTWALVTCGSAVRAGVRGSCCGEQAPHFPACEVRLIWPRGPVISNEHLPSASTCGGGMLLHDWERHGKVRCCTCKPFTIMAPSG